MELTEKQIKDLVARRHPEYIKKKEHWDFLASTYAGGRAWFDDNISDTSKKVIRSSRSVWNAPTASITPGKW